MEGKVLTTRFRLWVILAVFMVIAFLGTQSKIVNAEPVEMTICTGEDINSRVPFNGYYCDCNFKTQYIIPANMISGLKKKYISTMTFYPKKEMEDFDYKTRMCVYLSEVNESSFATKKFYDISGNPVYDGDVSIKNNKVAIELDDFYLYNGGNLLVTFVCYGEDVGGDYCYIGFLGKESEATALSKVQDEEEDYEMHDFLPKTTFTF